MIRIGTVPQTGAGIQISPRISFHPRDGRVQEPRKQIVKSDIDLELANAAAGRYEIEIDQDNNSPYAIVTYRNHTAATQEDPETLSETWSIEEVVIEKTLWELPRIQAELSKITDPIKTLTLRKFVEAITSGQTTFPDPSDGVDINVTWESLSNLCSQYGVEFLELASLVASMSRGTESFQDFTYSLKKTVIRPANTSLSPVFDNRRRLFTTGGLKSLEPTMMNNIARDLPQGFWLKQAVEAQQDNDGRWVYRVPYLFAEYYDPFVYGEPVA